MLDMGVRPNLAQVISKATGRASALDKNTTIVCKYNSPRMFFWGKFDTPGTRLNVAYTKGCNPPRPQLFNQNGQEVVPTRDNQYSIHHIVSRCVGVIDV